ncbi:MAG TPA: DUF721 domain-containing protein [Pyrinomonadaceae bacterium]|nr:DUF721 domain-containing protein [Pyrinomonadaceae bacterium]
MDAFFRTLPGLIDAVEGSAEVREAVIFAAWRRIAGAQVSDRTEPVALQEKRLVVAVADKTWKRNLEELSGQLLYKLNAALGSSLVKFIEFRIEPASIDHQISSPESEAERKDAERAAIADLVPDVAKSAASIKDEAMRKTFMLAAANCLSRAGSGKT